MQTHVLQLQLTSDAIDWLVEYKMKQKRGCSYCSLCGATYSNDQWTYCVERHGVFFSGPLNTRLIYVGNLPAGIAEEALKECFPDALRAIIPSKEKEESSEKSGG